MVAHTPTLLFHPVQRQTDRRPYHDGMHTLLNRDATTPVGLVF